MKIIFILIRAVGVLGAAYIVYWLIGWHTNVLKELPPESVTPAVLDQLLYFTTIPFAALAFFLVLPYSLLPRPARKICRLLLLLLGAYFLFYRFGAYFLPSPHPYSKPETLTLDAIFHLIFWIAFFIAQLFAIYNIDSNMPKPPPLKGGSPPKAPLL